jgi:gas vesicle structural protein
VYLLKENGMARLQKSTDSSSLAEVVDRILDKGIVIDAWVKISLVGIELITIEARVVVASVETYLKYAEAVGLTASAAAPAYSIRDASLLRRRECISLAPAEGDHLRRR